MDPQSALAARPREAQPVRTLAPASASLDAVLGLGSNMGDRVGHLYRALLALARQSRVTGVSALYCTSPVGGPPQREFLNAAVRLSFKGRPEALMTWLLRLEQLAGRRRTPALQWAPRPLDLDVLWIEGMWLNAPRLIVPHPRLEQRAFALWPLLDVAPSAAHPLLGHRYSQVAQALGSPAIRARLGDWIGSNRLPVRDQGHAVDKPR